MTGKNRRNGLAGYLARLGPGLITGAADDDPSGIGTYSIAGAQFGFTCLWTAWFSFPLMAAVQLICARVGMVSGRGLSSLLRERFGPRVLWPVCTLLALANVFNIGADLAAMAASSAMVTGIPAQFFTPFYAGVMLLLMAYASYRRISRIFKWMTLVLFAYIIDAFLARPDWHAVLQATLLPHLPLTGSSIATFVALMGTTISPYLFFWQANQQVEEDVAHGKTTLAQRQGASEQEKSDSRLDVLTGAFYSNLIMYFIILTTGATLNLHGQTHIATTSQAAEALRPLAGKGAYLIFTLGIIGTGMLSIPVLAGSTAYAIAEAARWRDSLKYPPRKAPHFYLFLAAAFLIGLALNYAGFGVVNMLFWSAVINGVLAAPLIVLIVLMASDPVIMGKHVNSLGLRVLGWTAAGVMSVASVAMFCTLGA